MSDSPKLTLVDVTFAERDVTMRMPFKFGVVTMTKAPQVFVTARIALSNGREGTGSSAELLAPKWFDKSPDLSNEDNFDQLRKALTIAADAYRGQPARTAFGLHAASAADVSTAGEEAGLPPLATSFGPALVDRAILDALTRLVGVSIFEAARDNLFGLDTSLTPDLSGTDLGAILARLAPQKAIAARHTVGLVDPITAGDLAAADRVNDGLPETLEEVVSTYGVSHFKLKVGGNLEDDVERLTAIAGVIDALPDYRATLDGNEQYGDVDAVIELWRAIEAAPTLQRLASRVLFIEQPIRRSVALSKDIGALAALKPVEIDESDGTLDAFLTAKVLSYTGVSSKSCKGFYKALLNRARCAVWNEAAGEGTYFMSAEDLTTQAGLAVQQDLALATLIGCDHVERNGHHYVNGMSGASEAEQDGFLAAHPDLYERSHGAVRVKIENGRIAIGSLDQPGFASAVLPDLAEAATVR